MPSRPPALRRALGTLTALLVTAGTLAACTGSTVTGHGSARAGTSGGGASSAPSGFPSSSAPAPTQPRADFRDCKSLLNLSGLNFPSGRLGKLDIDCAQIKVPLYYARPGGRTITLQLLRIHDTDDHHPEGQLLINPGGPGVSGLNFAVGFATEVPDAILSHYDLVGFDPRGVGLSTPITCLSNHRKDVLNAMSPNVLTGAGFAQARSTARSIARACSDKYGSSLADFDTVNTARDMDQIRQAVGDTSMHYLGFSYGTELGSVYAHLFPSKVGRMVLDGAVNPLTSSITADADQLVGFEKAFDQFSSKYCVTTSPCKSLGDPRKAVYALQRQAMRKPIPVSGSSRTLTYSLLTTGVLQALYSRSLWSHLGAGLLAARKGNGQILLSLADQYNERYSNGSYANVAEANTAISCNDEKNGPSDATIRATARSWVRRFPMFGLSNAASLFTCQQWQKTRTVPPKPRARSTAHKVLVLGNTHDPATPYQGAIDLTHVMGNAELLSWDGEGHTSYLQGSTCIDRFVNRYLDDGTLPPDDKTCPAS